MDINSITNTTLADQAASLQPAMLSEPPRKVASQQAEEKEQQVNDLARTQMMVKDIQRNLSNLDVSLTFSTYGKNNDQISIAVVEKASGKVIREIPSKELQSLYTKMQEVVGMIFDKEA